MHKQGFKIGSSVISWKQGRLFLMILTQGAHQRGFKKLVVNLIMTSTSNTESWHDEKKMAKYVDNFKHRWAS